MKVPYGGKQEVGLLNARLELPGRGAPKTKEDSEPANCISERVPYESKPRPVKEKYFKIIGSSNNGSNHERACSAREICRVTAWLILVDAHRLLRVVPFESRVVLIRNLQLFRLDKIRKKEI